MTTSTELDYKVKKYIIDCIEWSGYDLETEPTTTREKIAFLHDTFMSEYGWQVERVGEQQALIDWIMGLPSSCNVEYRNHEILKLAADWGSIPVNATERQQDKILGNWFNLIAVKTGQLFRGYRLPKSGGA